MKNDYITPVDNAGEGPSAQCDSRLKRIEESKRIADPQNFDYDGIKVRVFYEGTADLNDLVKGLFMAG